MNFFAFFLHFFRKKFGSNKKMPTFAIPNENNAFEITKNGAIAQLVEQRTENPCVPGSIPGGTTKTAIEVILLRFFCVLR